MTRQALISDDKVSRAATQSEHNHLSEEETKHFLTPFAFKMDKSLFGLPLASPSKRGIALLIDLAFIALLANISGVVLALAIAITLYRLGNKKRAQASGKTHGYKRRAIMRFIAAFMVFIVLLDTLPPLLEYLSIENSSSQDTVLDKSLSIGQFVAITAFASSAIITIADSDCQSLTCWQKELDSVAKKIANISFEGEIEITKQQLDEIFTDISEVAELTIEEQDQLVMLMHEAYNQEWSALGSTIKAAQNNSPKAELAKENEEENAQVNDTDDTVFVLGNNGQLTSVEELTETEKSNKPVYSIIEWVKGIINDLGLGFCWATFYFTAFIALGQGQTLGKKLLGIKVLQLDGTPLSLWDSFGRYGGYGAGLATGLLGFIQIYWDPNRQAIHDKISATVVIDIRKDSLKM